jgi:pimeloyl-ACP methyl ester carboxylesterase
VFERIGDVEFNTVSFGAGARTIVAHGGWTGSWQLWQQPFELLSATWRCISYDHRGSGETVAPIESITAETLVADLFAVLDSLGVGRCVLAGESMGGLVAMAAALAEPERFEGLVLVSSPVPGQRGAERLIAGSRIDYTATATAFARACLPEPDSGSYLRWGTAVLLRSEGEVAARLLEASEAIVIDPAEIEIPTLILHGTADAIVPASAGHHLASTIPDAELVLLDGAGHVPTFTRTREVVDAIQRRFGLSSV